MDKTNRILALAEDNAAHIERIYSELRRLQKTTVPSFFTATGKPTTSDGAPVTMFGSYIVDGEAAAIVAFDGGITETLKFAGKEVCSGRSPMIISLPLNNGFIRLNGTHADARLLIFGYVRKNQ